MAACPSCGSDVGDARFCRMCGTELGRSPRHDSDSADAAGSANVVPDDAAAPTAVMPPADAVPDAEAPTAVAGAAASPAPPSASPSAPPTELVPRVAEFDSLYRPVPGQQPGPHDSTQVLPPVPAYTPPSSPDAPTSRNTIWDPDQPDPDRRSHRLALLGIGIAAAAAIGLVCAFALAGGSSSNTPAAQATNTPSPTPTVVLPTPVTSGTAPYASSAPPLASTSPTPSPTPSSTPTPKATPTQNSDFSPLHLGSRGSRVRHVQRILRGLGLYHGSIDGDYGVGTLTAVAEFQAAHGITQDPLGTVGATTWAALNSVGGG
jgi:hypothetical protein